MSKLEGLVCRHMELQAVAIYPILLNFFVALFPNCRERARFRFLSHGHLFAFIYFWWSAFQVPNTFLETLQTAHQFICLFPFVCSSLCLYTKSRYVASSLFVENTFSFLFLFFRRTTCIYCSDV